MRISRQMSMFRLLHASPIALMAGFTLPGSSWICGWPAAICRHILYATTLGILVVTRCHPVGVQVMLHTAYRRSFVVWTSIVVTFSVSVQFIHVRRRLGSRIPTQKRVSIYSSSRDPFDRHALSLQCPHTVRGLKLGCDLLVYPSRRKSSLAMASNQNTTTAPPNTTEYGGGM